MLRSCCHALLPSLPESGHLLQNQFAYRDRLAAYQDLSRHFSFQIPISVVSPQGRRGKVHLPCDFYHLTNHGVSSGQCGSGSVALAPYPSQ